MKKNYLLLLMALCAAGLSAQVHNQWVWIKGDTIPHQVRYGLIGVEDESNWPAARVRHEGLVDSTGKYWIYGGAFNSTTELWVYDPATGNFTCKKSYSEDPMGFNKGTGIEDVNNYPPMEATQSWIDDNDNIWLFSPGNIVDRNNSTWKYNIATGNWVEVRATTMDALANFGTMGVSSPDNYPPGVSGATTWKDGNGDIWMYGGNATAWDAINFNNFCNALWKFDIETEEWTWVWGSQDYNDLGSYVEKGVESAENYPGSRDNAQGWVDDEGNLWLFGGRGPLAVSGNGNPSWMSHRNDLWKFNPGTGLWTWIAGYGTPETAEQNTDPSPSPEPGTGGFFSWQSGGNFWVYGHPQTLWNFNMDTQSWNLIEGETWESESLPVYGEKGVPNPENTPGYRWSANGFVGPDGDLYLLHGQSLNGALNDMWRFDISENAWAWIEGCDSPTCPQRAKFEGVMRPDINPGSYSSKVSDWTDSEGNLWFLSGSQQLGTPGSYSHTHMWKYNRAANQWQWKSGRFTSAIPDTPVLGVEDEDIHPLFSADALTWTDANNNLWLFGGSALDENSLSYNANALWKYNTQTNNWTWVNGSLEHDAIGIYGTQGVAASGNMPGGRTGTVKWTDNNGNFWLFGGGGTDGSNVEGTLNDLWKYDVATNQWTWMKGSQVANSGEVDNGIGVIDATSTPNYNHSFSVGWKDSDGNLWLSGLSSVWKYDIAANVWIKISVTGELNHGTLGVPDAVNSPGPRSFPLTWADANGDLILYGGIYNTQEAGFYFNSDQWRFSVAAGMWIWTGGSAETGAVPNYGTQGTVNYYNYPGALADAITWTDSNGNRMIYGGLGYSYTPGGLYLYNNVWMSTGAFNTVTGTIKFDSDDNGCQPGDISASNIKVNFTNGTNPGFVFTNENGSYTLFADSGEVTITAESDTFTVSPASQTFSFDGYQNTETLDFCLTAPTPVNDLEVTVIPVDQARPGFDANYKLVYTNKGTTTLSGTVQFDYDDAVLDFVLSDTTPTLQSTGLLEWNYASLAPFQSAEVNIVLNINSPMETPAVNGGDILAYTATVSPVTGDATQGDNTFALNQEVVNSLDPNDKTCLQGETITEDMVGDYVTYLIRFENTGTANAINVIVEDVIDISKFDIASIQPLAASHSYRLEVTEGNVVTFIFEGIQLQFGEDNPLRHGFVSFRIKTLPTLMEGDIFDNTADIYFDYNFPVITNTAQTSIEENVNGTEDFGTSLSWYPNPVKDRLTLSDDSFEKAVVYDMAGRIIMSTHMAGNTVNLEHLSAGVYVVKLSSGNKSASIKIIKE